MAIGLTALASYTSATNGDTFTTGSVSPSANALVLLAVESSGVNSGDCTDPTGVSGAGLTFTKISGLNDGGYANFSLWRAMSASPSSGGITITYAAADPREGVCVSVVEFTGVDTSGTNGSGAVVQSAANTATTTGITVTLAAFGSADNATFGAFGADRVDSTGPTSTEGSGFTEIHDFEDVEGTPGFSYAVTTEWKSTNDTSVDVTWSAVDWTGGIAIEVKAASTAASIEQEGFRLGADDGSESAHGWLAAQDTNLTAPLDTNTLLRLLINGTGDPASAAYTLRYQENGSGGYVAVPTSATSVGTSPLIESGDCTVSGSNTASSSWAVSHPNASTGDLLIFYVAWDDSTTTTDCTAPAGPNSETLTAINETPVTDSSTETRAKAWYCVATGSWTAGTVTFTPSASESWSASVVRIPAGEFDATTPIGATATSAATSGTDTTVDSPAFSAGSSDGGGTLLWFAGVDADPLSATDPTGWSILQSQDLGAVAHGVAKRTTSVTNSESIASATWSIAGDSWTSIAVIVRAPVTTNPVYIAASTNITAGGEATTARLTAPSGKTTSDFVTGRRWDDENGTDSVDITADDYTELEWCLRAQSPAETDDYYEFRVYAGSTALDTYTVTPKWTIGGGSITGTLATTESGADTAALAGDVLIDGSLAATESGGDTAALAGDVLIAGTFAATESGADVAAIQGTAQQVSTGSLAATESGADTASIAGTVLVEGALAATESGSDTAAIAGDVPVSGTLAATESWTDTAALAGDVYISGALAATESGSDTAAIEGSLAVIATGSLAATESGSDTASIAGVVLVSGSLAATEAANDSAAMSGVVLITGTLDATESGQDTAAISSAPPVTTAYPGPAGKSRGKRRRVVIRERVYEVSERDIPALIEAELLDRAPPVTAEVVAGPKPPRKRRKSATQPVKTVEQVREAVEQIKARIEPDNAWLAQALEAVAYRVLERLQDEEDSIMLLVA